MDRDIEDPTPGEEWRESLNATCNRLSAQYLNLIRSASSVTALDAIAGTTPLSSSLDVPTTTTGTAGTGTGIVSGNTTTTTTNIGTTTTANISTSVGVGVGTTSTSNKADPRSGGGSQRMTSLQDPPPPPLAADVASSAIQCQVAVENLCVAASHLLSLIRTLRLSILLMDEDTIAAEEEWQVLQMHNITQDAQTESNKYEMEWMELRNNGSNCNGDQ